MNDYIVYHNIDWLSYTTPLLYDEIGHDISMHFDVENRGMMGYTHRATAKDSGEMILFSPDNPKQKTHVILSGRALQWYRYNWHSDVDIVRDAMSRGNIRRIDIAITSHPTSIAVSHEFRAIEQQEAVSKGRVKTRLTRNTGVTNDGKLRTMYLGKKVKKYRGYDKGLEMGFVSNWLQRYELQSNGDGANTVARQVAEGQDIGEIMNRYIEFDNHVWRRIVGSDKSVLSHAPESIERDTVGWLRDVAASALAKRAIEYRDTPDEKTGEKKDPIDVIEWFNRVVLQKIRQLDSES